MLKFKKMHGLGNDFVMIDCRGGQDVLSKEQVIAISNRKRGVGCDQLIHILPPKSAEADIFLDMYNPDGSELRACGNGTRCAADIIMQETGQDRVVIETVAGLLVCTRAEGGMVTADMGVPKLDWQDIPLSKECDTLHLPLDGDPVAVNIGNPHCVFFVDDADQVDLEGLGAKFERDPLFPDRVNVEFISVLAPNHLRMRVWERGAGVTEACGSGACASAVAAIRRELTDRSVKITLDGGDLHLEWRESDDHILMTGPVAYVFDGELSL